MGDLYYDPEYDRIVLTCSVPLMYRGDPDKIQHLATVLCGLAITQRVVPTWDNSKVAWCEIEDLFFKGYKVIAVFLVGDRPQALPEPQGELDLGNLLKEDGDGQQGSLPPTPE